MSADTPEPLPAATGIVLAGGRSTRFGRDKLVEPVGGLPLVHRPILALAAVCREVIVALPPSGGPPLPGADEAGVPIRGVRDEEANRGPLAGLLAALEHAREPVALVVAGDMPSLSPAVLAALLRALEAGEHEAVGLVLRGRPEQLPVALRVGAATTAVRRLLGVDERRLGALRQVLRGRLLDEAEWRALDPAAATVRDVDRPEDLRA